MVQSFGQLFYDAAGKAHNFFKFCASNASANTGAVLIGTQRLHTCLLLAVIHFVGYHESKLNDSGCELRLPVAVNIRATICASALFFDFTDTQR